MPHMDALSLGVSAQICRRTIGRKTKGHTRAGFSYSKTAQMNTRSGNKILVKGIEMDDVKILIEQISDENTIVQSKALRSLIRLGPEARSAIPALINKLDDPNYAIANTAWQALLHIGEESLGALIEAAKIGPIQRRTFAMAALGSNIDYIDRVLPILTNALSDNNSRIRAQAAKTILGIKIFCIKNGLSMTKELAESANISRKIMDSIKDDLSAGVTLRELKKMENNEE
jgi:HEAT repeats/HEAT repeat